MRYSERTTRVRMLPPGPRRVSLLVIFSLLALVLIAAPEVLLVIFAGLLFGVFFSSGGEWLAHRVSIGRNWGIGLFVLLVLLALAGAMLAFAPAAAEQFDRLAQEVPAAIERVRERIGRYAWGDELLRRATPGALMSEGGEGTAVTAVATTFGMLGNFVIMFFIGLYVSLDTRTYRRGLISILAPSLRAPGEAVLGKAGDTLRNWLAAQLMSMAVVGVLTWLGLWLVGVPLAPILGLIAALLAFVPNIGPIIAAVPAVLLGLSDGRPGPRRPWPAGRTTWGARQMTPEDDGRVRDSRLLDPRLRSMLLRLGGPTARRLARPASLATRHWTGRLPR